MSQRLEKINSLLKKEVAQVILKEIEFKEFLVSITDADATPDLTQATLLITVMPEIKEKEALLTLKKNIYDIQQKINKKFKMKPVPKIRFEIDQGMKNFYKIDKISKEIQSDSDI